VYNHTFGFWTPGPDTLEGDIFNLLKAEMVTKEISGYVQISPEEVLVRDPEVIITSVDAVSEITDDPALQSVTAVKNGRVLVPELASLFIAGPRLIDVIEEIAEFLYPELF
jgi:iron complex transport system substrate-binding protein